VGGARPWQHRSESWGEKTCLLLDPSDDGPADKEEMTKEGSFTHLKLTPRCASVMMDHTAVNTCYRNNISMDKNFISILPTKPRLLMRMREFAG
jgi:hypothetical protein